MENKSAEDTKTKGTSVTYGTHTKKKLLHHQATQNYERPKWGYLQQFELKSTTPDCQSHNCSVIQ